MVSAHEQARSEFATLAAEVAARIVNVAFPPLKQKYDRGAKRPTADVNLPGRVSRRLYDKTDHDIDLIDEIGELTFEKAKADLKSRLGRTCTSVLIARTTSGAIKRGDRLSLTVTAYFE